MFSGGDPKAGVVTSCIEIKGNTLREIAQETATPLDEIQTWNTALFDHYGLDGALPVGEEVALTKIVCPGVLHTDAQGFLRAYNNIVIVGESPKGGEKGTDTATLDIPRRTLD